MTNLQFLSLVGNAILIAGAALLIYAAYRAVKKLTSKQRSYTLEETF